MTNWWLGFIAGSQFIFVGFWIGMLMYAFTDAKETK